MLPGPSEDKRIAFSADKKTLIIANISSADAGVYKVQFNRIDVHPYNQTCNDELISLLRGYPILAPVVYCVNVYPCTSEDPTTLQVQRVNVHRLNFNLSDGLVLLADGIAYSAEELEHLSFRLYRNGRYVHIPQYYYDSIIQRHYPMISQKLQVTRSEVVYEETGRYEVALITIHDHEYNCQAYYDQLLTPYCRTCSRYSAEKKYDVPLSWAYIDVSYYKSKHLHNNVIFKIYK
jgi:hypothetical protein